MYSNNRVQLFDASTRKLLASVGRKGQIRPGRMQEPEGVAFVDGRPEVKRVPKSWRGSQRHVVLLHIATCDGSARMSACVGLSSFYP